MSARRAAVTLVAGAAEFPGAIIAFDHGAQHETNLPAGSGLQSEAGLIAVPVGLSEESKRALLRLARATLDAHFRGEPPPRLASDRAETFGEPRGVFVTLRMGEDLRGCIGTLAPEGDLPRTVPRFALSSALEDPRFPPLTAAELSRCRIEISVLTPPRRLEGVEEIEVGRDGLILEVRGRRGLLLPQVATEWGFDRERFLAEISKKAGLPPNAWQDPDALLWSFQAEVFGE